jgi:hypothetical protein
MPCAGVLCAALGGLKPLLPLKNIAQSEVESKSSDRWSVISFQVARSAVNLWERLCLEGNSGVLSGLLRVAVSSAHVAILRVQRFNQRVALHRVLGCPSGYKTCERFNQKVVILFDTYHGSNLRSGLGC